MTPDNYFDVFFSDDSPCFCGSERSFKVCHKTKIYRHPNELFVERTAMTKWWDGCGVMKDGARCGDKVVASHSIQRQGALKSISESGHVYTFPNGRHSTVVEDNKFVRVGTRKASTFYGLCAKHDREIFAEIEGDMNLNYRSCLGLAERAILFEALEHTKGVVWLDYLSKYPKFMFPYDAGLSDLERRNMRHYSSYCWVLLRRIQAIKRKSTPRKFRFVAIEFAGATPFCATGCFCIELDYFGNILQDFTGDGPFNYAQLSVLQIREDCWGFAISAVEDLNPRAARSLLASLLRQEENTLADCALRGIVVHTENAYFRPSWIDALDAVDRYRVISRFTYGTDFGVGQRKAPDTLARPLLSKFGFEVISISHNLNSA